VYYKKVMEEKTEATTKKPTAATATAVRPTKKQKELLTYIEGFINVRGYSPSYREIMKGLNYTSVATVALHVNSLIKRGHLQKRDRSARSIEVVKSTVAQSKVVPKQLRTSEAKWLVEKVEHFFKDVENSPELIEKEIDQLYVLIGALKVLGLDGASQAFIPRLSDIKKRKDGNEYVV
jgi:SOS-response transcriptional repressor LexA